MDTGKKLVSVENLFLPDLGNISVKSLIQSSHISTLQIFFLFSPLKGALKRVTRNQYVSRYLLCLISRSPGLSLHHIFLIHDYKFEYSLYERQFLKFLLSYLAKSTNCQLNFR